MSLNVNDPYAVNRPDMDPEETAEWLESLNALTKVHGRERASEIMANLLRRARELQINVPHSPTLTT